MNDSKIFELFSEVIDEFGRGEFDSDALRQKINDIISETERVSTKLFQDLSSLIDSADLKPQDRQRILLMLVEKQHSASGRVFNDETIEYSPISKTSVEPPTEQVSNDISEQNSAASNSDSSQNSSPDSSLLRRLLEGDHGDNVKKVQANEIIRGTYRLESVVGKGGMGEVWKAIDLIQDAGDSRDKYVAIKFLSTEFRRHGNALKALVREFARYKKLIHPNIVRAYELNRDYDAVYIAMEFLEGMPLDRFIKQNPDGIPLKEAKLIIKGMCDALDHAHQEGIIHLDFKPGNVFYNASTGTAKVIDFGIARLARPDEREATRFDPGSLGAKTNAYATAEMLAETHPQPSDDVYGLACVVYELLSGKHPYKKKNAIQAEHEKISPKPIKDLSQNQFKALKKGLACRRKNRTATAKGFYEALFPSKTLPHLLRSRGFLKVLIVVAGFALAPILYSAYESYRLIAIVSDIKQLKTPGVEDFRALDPDDQVEILEDSETRNALMQYFIQNVGELSSGAIAQLQGFSPRVQRLLLQDREIRGLLINDYIDKINRAIHEDDFNRAKQYAKRISEKYPDSNALAETLKGIPLKKAERLDQLRQQYNDCLYQINKSLVDLAPCLTETQSKLRQLHPASDLLVDTRLSARYQREMATALANNDTVQAQHLLQDWKALYPSNFKERQDLEVRLIYDRKLASLISRVQRGESEDLAQVIRTELLKADPRLKSDLISDTLSRKKLIGYYETSVADQISRRQYSNALAYVQEAKILFAGDRKGKSAISRLQKRVASTKSKEFDTLSKEYWLLLSREEPNSKALKQLHAKIASIAPDSHLLEYPRATEIFSDRIEAAIRQHKFDLALRNLDAWKVLKPKEAKGKLFKSLVVKREAAIKDTQLQTGRRKKLDRAVESGRLRAVKRVLAELPDQDKREMLNEVEEKLTKLLLDSIELAIQANKYELAQKRTAEALALYPGSSQLLLSKSNIDRARSARMANLVGAYQKLLDSDALRGKKIFQSLVKLESIEQGYLNNHPNLINDLKNTIQRAAQSRSGLLQLKEVFSEWRNFNSNSDSSQHSKDSFSGSKNMIALRCFISGRELKKQGNKRLSDDVLKFGLSLNPISSVKLKLNEELHR